MRRFDACAELTAMLRMCGAVPTLDDRRYARAAEEWPDHLPPMFGEAAVARERWSNASGMWMRSKPTT